MKKILSIGLLSILLTSCYEKETKVIALHEPVPSYTFTNVLNSSQKEISTNNLKGKVVVLEFWATWCGPCIPAMKKLDSLQKEFGDQLEVITVSNESEKRLQKYIETSQTSLKIASDSIHQDLFHYKIIPHSILIGKDGTVLAITAPKNITKDVIADALAEKSIALKTKNDFYVDQSIEVNTLKTVTHKNYRIELTSYDPEKRGGYQILKNDEGKIKGITFSNSPLSRIFQTLYNVESHLRIVYKDGLSEKDFPYKGQNRYNFTIEASNDYLDQWRDSGVAFLNDYFDINARISSEFMSCIVLKDTDQKLRESTQEETSYMFQGTLFDSKKIKIQKLAEYLENFSPVPVIDQTNLEGVYDFTFEWQHEDPATLHTELKKYGLKIEKSKEELPVRVMELYKKKA